MSNIKKFRTYNKVGSSFKQKARYFFKPQIKHNDEIAERYIKMLYEHWNFEQNLKKVFIINSDGYSKLSYRISKEPRDRANVGGFSDHYIDINFLLIKESGWDNDYTKARIEVSRFDIYKGERRVIGRDMDSGEVIVDENGIEKNVYSYINISPEPIKELIDYFINEYKTRYPGYDSKGGKYYNYMQIIDLENKDKEKVEDIDHEVVERIKTFESFILRI